MPILLGIFLLLMALVGLAQNKKEIGHEGPEAMVRWGLRSIAIGLYFVGAAICFR